MSDLIGLFNLLVPFFGLIGLGFFCGRVVKQPEAGLAWMQFFLIYVALPCLFYRLIADKPLDELANWPFIAATTFSTFCAFTLSFVTGWRYTRDMAAIGDAGRGRVLFQHRLYGTAAHPRGDRRRGQRPGRPDLRLRQPVPVLGRAAADVDGGPRQAQPAGDDPPDRLAGPDASLQRGDGRRHRGELPASPAAAIHRSDRDLALRARPRPAPCSSSA